MDFKNQLLFTKDLKKHFAPRQGFLDRVQTFFPEWHATRTSIKEVWSNLNQPVAAVDGVSLSIGEKEVVGLVGESGSGKTTLGRLLVRLIPATAGEITFNGVQITKLSQSQMRDHRQSIRMMFQKPGTILNPKLTIQQILLEAIAVHNHQGDLFELISMVNLPENTLHQYTNDLSGGLQRRVTIARTIVGNPKLIIADEPVAGLDVSIQAQIINLMKKIRQTHGIAYLLISHNLKLIQYLSSRILVMYQGRIIEQGTTHEISKKCCHPYTIDLLKAANYDLNAMNLVPSTAEKNNDKNGCPYRFDGCPIYESGKVRRQKCDDETPNPTDMSKTHRVACHYPDFSKISA